MIELSFDMLHSYKYAIKHWGEKKKKIIQQSKHSHKIVYCLRSLWNAVKQ